VRACFGPFSIDTERRRLEKDGGELHLTPKAFDLLVLLIQAAPKVVSKQDIHARLWPDSFVADATLVGLVKEVRRVLQQRGDDPIRTYHRVGYAFSGSLAIWLNVSGVSRRHACLMVAGTSVTLEDLGSKNGTLCGNERITKTVLLKDGDRLQVAGVVLVFRATSATASTDTRPQRAPRRK